MRYIVLVIGIILVGWGIWIIGGRADNQALHAAELCSQTFLNDNSSWLKCNSDAYASAGSLKTRAIWSIIIGLIFVILSSLTIYGSRSTSNRSSE